jgi:uncharacterized iron-regulated protein
LRGVLALAFMALVALAGCATTLRASSSEAPIVDVASGGLVDAHALVAALVPVRFRLLGEIHDDAAHHAIRARLLAEIASHGVRLAVVFEQFDLDHAAALAEAQRHDVDADALARAGQLDRKGWNWPLHEPIIAAALASHLPIRAGNLSRKDIASLTATTDAATEADKRATRWSRRLHDAQWTDAQARALTADIEQGHCNMLPANVVPRLVLGERMRDAAMAQALVDDATADGAILIAGNGHVRANLGVPVYLHAPGFPGAGARSVSVGFVEADATEVRDRDARARLIAAHPGFDYLVVTPPIARPDPCEAFRQHAK